MNKTNYKTQKEKIKAEPEDKKGYIRDYITDEWIKDKPENREAKVIFEERLEKEYGYSKKQMKPEFGIKKGSKYIGPADIVVFRDEKDRSLDNLYIIVECKRKERSDGIDQLKSYLAPTKAKYGVWFNGKEIAYIRHADKPPYFRPILNIPREGEALGLPRKEELKPATDLKSVFRTCHNYIYANDGLLKDKAFNEILKILFLKMIDEKKTAETIAKFGITEDEQNEILEGKKNNFLERMDQLFTEVKRRYRDVFPDANEKINLRNVTIAFVVAQLQNLNLRKTPVDIKGIAFQEFVHAYQRGERGEFFTPDPIIKLVVEMMNPKEDEMVLDPACGSAGFLVVAMRYVWQKMKETIKDKTQLREAQKEYGIENIRGIDFNPDLARVSKMRMVLEDDGHTGIFSENSLETFDKIKKTGQEVGTTKIDSESFDLILTNPPFGTKGKVSDKNILKQFDLGYKWKEENDKFKKTDRLQDSQVPDILFIERCLEFLAPYGRIGIVLPDGDLTNTSLRYVREYIKNKARILAVVSLPQETFVWYGSGVKSSVLFLQKLPEKELEKLKKKDYPIFMGVVEKIGYDIRGREVYKRDEKGEVVKDEKGKLVVDEDVSKIVEEFEKFKEKYKLDF